MATSPGQRAVTVIDALVVIAVLAILAAIFFPVFARTDCGKFSPSCQSNLKELGAALLLYAGDHDGRLPPAPVWQDRLRPYVREPWLFRCPPRVHLQSGYAFHQDLGGASLDRIVAPAEVPALFDSLLGMPNAADRLQSFAREHGGGGNVAYADGHVKWSRAAREADAR